MAFAGLDKLRLPEVAGEAAPAAESTGFLSSFFGSAEAAAPAAAPAPAAAAIAPASSSWSLPWGSGAAAIADVEAGGSGAAAEASTEEGGEQTGFLSAFRAMAGTTPAEDEGMFAMGAGLRFQLFVGLIMMSMLFLGLAFTFLPLVVLRPAKFGFAFTMGSVLFMLAFAALKGPKAYCRAQCERKALPATAAYWSSMLLTLYSCVVAQSYVMVVLSSGLMVGVMLWFSVGNLPGGKDGLKLVGMMFVKTAKLIFAAAKKMITS